MAEISKNSDNAVLLLAAAYKLGLDASAVRSTSKGLTAPDKVMAEAGFDPETGEPAKAPEPKKAPAKKAAKKSTSKE